jgi:hypothetical protein
MKRIISTFLLLWAILLTAYSQNVATLVVTLADGTTTSYELNSRPRVTFINDSVKISSPTVNAEYLAANVLRFNYLSSATAIKKTTEDTKFSREGEYIVFSGNVSAKNIKLFTVSGVAIPATFITSGSDVRLRITSLQRGVYIVSVNGKTFKFVKL